MEFYVKNSLHVVYTAKVIIDNIRTVDTNRIPLVDFMGGYHMKLAKRFSSSPRNFMYTI